MDPNANLNTQLDLARAIANGDFDEFPEHEAAQLAELVLALDKWLASDGFLPERWLRRVRIVNFVLLKAPDRTGVTVYIQPDAGQDSHDVLRFMFDVANFIGAQKDLYFESIQCRMPGPDMYIAEDDEWRADNLEIQLHFPNAPKTDAVFELVCARLMAIGEALTGTSLNPTPSRNLLRRNA